ncbi:MAG: phosphodiester glycosidase family protein [Clostridia bacterium]|nr:phosphodiester glycosidase family protein [Clostridia bacterium]
MKKLIVCLGLLLLAVCMCVCACAADAKDITTSCTVSGSAPKGYDKMTDKKFTSYWDAKKAMNPYVTVKAKEPAYGLYLCFRTMPASYEIQIDNGNGWEKLADGDTRFFHVYYDLPGADQVRIISTDSAKSIIGFNEIYVFGEGETPSWVQRWEETPEKADILFLIARPSDDHIFLGGAIPYYAVEKGRSVVVATLTTVNTSRRSELLNGLWSMGYRYYPVMLGLENKSSKSVKKAYASVGKNGEDKVLETVTGLYRKYRPEVVVAPDENGEGTNGMRMMAADAAKQCFTIAADADRYPSAGEPWQVKKLYLHLYGTKDTQIVHDWTQPMEKLGGRTGLIAAIGAGFYYKTMDTSELSVQGTGTTYANNTFGLYAETVGADLNHNDFMENIPADCLTEPKELPSLETEGIEAVLPALNEKGFLDEGEFVYADDEHGLYAYVSTTLRVLITRKYDGSLPLRWFVSDILCDTDAGEMMHNVEYDPVKRHKVRVDAAENALKNKLVFAVNADYYTYRLGVKNGRNTGIIIRNGEIYVDDPNVKNPRYFPNLDSVALYKDGTAKVFHSDEVSAKQYLADGAYDVFSFGPYLLKDGQISEWIMDPTRAGFKSKAPRHCFGTAGKGHFIDVTAEGRMADSEGVTLSQLTTLAQAAGCTDTCNLDGGETAVVVFMGEQLNRIRNQVDGGDRARKTCEVLGVGMSEQVGTFEVK